FFSGGDHPPHPCAGPAEGYPLPPPGPAGRSTKIPQKPQNPAIHTGDSTRNTRSGHAEKRPFADKGGEGGEPPTPLPSFFPEGITPPPMCRAGRGGTPSPF